MTDSEPVQPEVTPPDDGLEVDGPPAGRPPLGLLAGLIALVVVVVLATHWQVLSARAVLFHDREAVFDNPAVSDPTGVLTGRLFGDLFKPSQVEGGYQPLATISLMLDHAAGGRGDDLRPFHRTGLVLHVLNAALVVVLLFSLFGRPWPAAMAGLLFGVHPLTVEPIAWIGQRSVLLATFFVLLSMILHVSYARRGGAGRYVLSLAVYLLALLSGPLAVCLPLLLLVLDWWPLRRFSARVLVEKAPFLVLAGAFAVVTVLSPQRADPGRVIEGPGVVPLAVCHDTVFYLWKTVWPMHLSAWYPIPDKFNLLTPAALVGVVGTCAIVVCLLILLVKTRAPLAGWLFFFLAALPSMGIFGLAETIAADRYAYLPLVGILLVVTWLLGRQWDAEAAPSESRLSPARAVLLASVLLLAVAEATVTRQYLARWRDTEEFDRYMVRLAPLSPALHTKLGDTLLLEHKLENAAGSYRQALSLNPRYFGAHYGLGQTFRKQGEFEAAVQASLNALRIKPGHLGALMNLGETLMAQRKPGDAATVFSAAIEADPDFGPAHYSLAMAYVLMGRPTDAADQLRDVLRLGGDDAATHYNLGLVLTALGKPDEAIEQYRKTILLAPEHAEAHNNLANLLNQQGRVVEAVRHYEESLRLNPDNAAAHFNFAVMMGQRGNLEQAAAHLREVLRLHPEDATAHFNLGVVLAETGATEEAVAEFEETVRINPNHEQAQRLLSEARAQGESQ